MKLAIEMPDFAKASSSTLLGIESAYAPLSAPEEVKTQVDEKLAYGVTV